MDYVCAVATAMYDTRTAMYDTRNPASRCHQRRSLQLSDYGLLVHRARTPTAAVCACLQLVGASLSRHD